MEYIQDEDMKPEVRNILLHAYVRNLIRQGIKTLIFQDAQYYMQYNFVA